MMVQTYKIILFVESFPFVFSIPLDEGRKVYFEDIPGIRVLKGI